MLFHLLWFFLSRLSIIAKPLLHWLGVNGVEWLANAHGKALGRQGTQFLRLLLWVLECLMGRRT